MNTPELQTTPEIAQLLRECEQIIVDTLAEPDTLHVSGYVREAADRAASQPSEAQARAQRDGSNVVAFPSAADEAQAAFFSTIDTARLLFLAKSEIHDLNQRDYIGRAEFNEKLLAECKRLCKGDLLKAQLLASAALED